MKIRAAVIAIVMACVGLVSSYTAVQAAHTRTQAVEVATACETMFGIGSDEGGGICGPATATEPAVRLNPPPPPPEPEPNNGYRSFPSCKEAVDYLFYGRWDFERAHRVVYRESRYQPNAVSRTGAKGCAQLTGGLLGFLGGPWYDPYWNVLAMRTAVDSPKWGWCHWDIVNYCRPGGEF